MRLGMCPSEATPDWYQMCIWAFGLQIRQTTYALSDTSIRPTAMFIYISLYYPYLLVAVLQTECQPSFNRRYHL